MRRITVPLLGLALALPVHGCKKEAPPTSSGEAVPEPPPPSRYSGKAGQFAEHLQAAPIRDYFLDVAGDARLTYEEMVFSADDRWAASASMHLGDEPYSCTESGTWALDADAAEGRDMGRVDLVMEETDCPGRKAPESWRIEVRYSGDDAEVVKR